MPFKGKGMELLSRINEVDKEARKMGLKSIYELPSKMEEILSTIKKVESHLKEIQDRTEKSSSE